MMHKLTRATLALFALAMMSIAALAADPGGDYNQHSEVSDQKAGSLLVYNIYTSAAVGAAQDTRINLTNTGSQKANVHFFFLDGSSCAVADMKMCLTPNQTTSLYAQELDPGINGYIIVVATDDDGCPKKYNYLIGDEYVKFATGHAANLGAEAFAALDTNPDACSATAAVTGSARLRFTGQGLDSTTDGLTAAEKAVTAATYNRVPRVLALDNIQSRLNGNDTKLIINRIGGTLLTGASSIGTMFGILYDDGETPLSFTINNTDCQYNETLSNTTIRTTPRLDTWIPTDRTGWMKIWATNDRGILGASINFHPTPSTTPRAFAGGHNLHKLTLTVVPEQLDMPVFPGDC